MNIIDSNHLELRGKSEIAKHFKGHVQLDLCDPLTGRVKERVEGENTFTNALDSLFNGAPYGIANRLFDNEDTRVYLDMQDIINKTLGGVQMFSNPLGDDVNDFFADFDNPLVGYASVSGQDTSDYKSGTFNAVESGEVTNGYKYVYDWATSNANGVVAGVGLTTNNGGYGSNTMSRLIPEVIYAPIYDDSGSTAGNIIEVEDKYIFRIYTSNTYPYWCKMSRITKSKFNISLDFMPWSSAPVAQLANRREGATAYTYYDSATKEIVCMIQTSTNSTSTTFNVTRYDIDDFPEEASTSTLTVPIGNLSAGNNSGGDQPGNGVGRTAYINGNVYFWNRNVGFIRVNLNNVADSEIIVGTDKWNSRQFAFDFNGKGILTSSGYLDNSGVWHDRERNNSDIQIGDITGVWATINVSRVGFGYMSNMLITKYNLEQAVTKTADKTMKLSYTVIQV